MFELGAEHLDLAVLRLLERHDLHERGGLAGAGLAHERHGLALAHVQRHVVHGLDLADLAAQESAGGQREGLAHVLDVEYHLAFVARDAGELRLGGLGHRVHVVEGQALAHDLLGAMAGHELARAAGNRLHGRLGGVADVGGQRATRRERAALGHVDQVHRGARNRHQAAVAFAVGTRHGTQQAHGVRHGRAVEDGVDVRLLDRAAGVHDDDVVGHAGDHAQIVGDEDDGRAGFTLGLAQHFEHLGLDRHVQCGGRFVGDDHVRVVGNGHGDHHALAHAAGELVREGLQAALRVRDADQVHELDGAVVNLLFGHLRIVGDQRFLDLVADGEHRGQSGERVLEDHGDALATDLAHLKIGLAEQFLAVVGDGALDAGVLVQQAHDGHGGHGLAGAGLAHDAEGLAGVQVEVHAAHRVHGAGFGGEADGEVAY